MKSTLQLSGPLGLIFLLLLTCVWGVQAQPGPEAAPPGRAPARPTVRAAAPASAPTIDPATGLPLPEAPPWKDPNWPEPNITLTNVDYDGVPLAEVAKHLRQVFKEAFDVLLPVNLTLPNGSEPIDPESLPIRMHLKNVTASEVFQAMNLVFENDRTSVRWELKLNGKRPVALLRVLSAYPPQPLEPRPEAKRTVYFVGDLLGDPKAGGMTLKQVVTTLSEVSEMAHAQPSELKYHEAAQLVIASGTGEQLRFIEMTLSALRKKVELERKAQGKTAENAAQTPTPKPGETAAPK